MKLEFHLVFLATALFVQWATISGCRKDAEPDPQQIEEIRQREQKSAQSFHTDG